MLAPRRRTGTSDRASTDEQLPRFAGHVLVVEDDSVSLLIEKELLAALGVTVSTAVDGADALQRLQSERFDLVIMDLQMPVMGGLEAVRKLRERELCEGIAVTPVVALTANSTADDRARCMGAGMDGFLAKPVTLDQLTALVAFHLKPA